LQLRKFKVKFQRLKYVLISHLHGDHFLGIFGLISSMNLLGRTQELTIFGPEGLEEIIRHQFKITQVYLGFELKFIMLNCTDKTKIFEDNSIEIFAFPLKHRVTCFGFLFQEKERDRKINKDRLKEYRLTLPEIVRLKKGENIERNGEIMLNENLTLPPEKPLSYAYCTDTKYLEKLPNWIEGVNLLYHEATFTKKHIERANATGHSTAEEAATIAEQAKVEKLLLGHFSARYKDVTPILEEAKEVFKNVICVNDGDNFSL